MKLTGVAFKNTVQFLKLHEFRGKLDDVISHLLLSRGCMMKYSDKCFDWSYVRYRRLKYRKTVSRLMSSVLQKIDRYYICNFKKKNIYIYIYI